MFYSISVLSHKGPLGKLWLAAHYEKKLTKQLIFATDISASVQSVLNPSVPLALRISGHLMLGIVRIYSRKMRYLVTDCTEALWKMKLSYHPTVVDIPEAIVSHIDDLRHFGNIRVEEEAFPMEMLAFTAQYEPVSSPLPSPGREEIIEVARPSKRRDRISLEIPSGRLSEVEYRRGESPYAPSPIGPPSRGPSVLSSASGQRARLTISQFDEDQLAPFDETMMISGSEEYSFTYAAPPSVPVVLPEHLELPSPTIPALLPSPEGFTTLPLSPVEEEREEEKPRRKRRLVEIDVQLELPNRVLRQRLRDTRPILRRQFGAPLPFELLPELEADAALVPIEERLGQLPKYRHVAAELRWVIDVSTNLLPMPFPSRGLFPPPPLVVPSAPIVPTTDLLVQPPPPPPFLPASAELARAEVPFGEERDRLSGLTGIRPSLLFPGATPSIAEESFPSFPAGEISPPIPFEFNEPALPFLGVDELESTLEGPSIPSAMSGDELRMGERTRKVWRLLQNNFRTQTLPVKFSELCQRASKRSVARVFSEILQLKTLDLIQLEQSSPYGELSIGVRPL